MVSKSIEQSTEKEQQGVGTPTDLAATGVTEISKALCQLLADVFALYVKTKNFHWHMSGRHFRDYHLLLDEQAVQIFAMTDTIAERARKIGGDDSVHQRHCAAPATAGQQRRVCRAPRHAPRAHCRQPSPDAILACRA